MFLCFLVAPHLVEAKAGVIVKHINYLCRGRIEDKSGDKMIKRGLEILLIGGDLPKRQMAVSPVLFVLGRADKNWSKARADSTF